MQLPETVWGVNAASSIFAWGRPSSKNGQKRANDRSGVCRLDGKSIRRLCVLIQERRGPWPTEAAQEAVFNVLRKAPRVWRLAP